MSALKFHEICQTNLVEFQRQIFLLVQLGFFSSVAQTDNFLYKFTKKLVEITNVIIQYMQSGMLIFKVKKYCRWPWT